MFRITKAFENASTFIYTIEGKVTDNSVTDWDVEISKLKSSKGRQVILDFSHVAFISPKGLEVLLNNISEDLYILNCGIELRNLFYASGLAARMLG